MGLFRITSEQREKQSNAEREGIYPNFLRDVILSRRFSAIERYMSMNVDDPELAEEQSETF